MPAGLAPILAQVLVLAAGDRAEVRRVTEFNNRPRVEAQNSASLAAILNNRNTTLVLQYAPSVLVTPLDYTPRNVALFQHAGLVGTIRFPQSRRTSFALSQSFTYDRTNTSLSALSGSGATAASPPAGDTPPPQTGGTTDPNDPNGGGQSTANRTNIDTRAADVTTEVGQERTQLTMSNVLSRRSTMNSFVGYSATAGLGDSARLYPLIHGPDVGLTYTYRLSRVDQLATNATTRYSMRYGGDKAITGSMSEIYTHRFSRYASLSLGVGATFVYYAPADGPDIWYFYPGAAGGTQIGYQYRTKWAGGRFTLAFFATYGTTIDQATFRPDPRIGLFTRAAWTRRELTLYAGVSGVFSVDPNEFGSLNSLTGALGLNYALGSGFYVEAGARAGWQTFGSETVLAPTIVTFAALSWGGATTL